MDRFQLIVYPGMTGHFFQTQQQLYFLHIRNWALTKYIVRVDFICPASPLSSSRAGKKLKG